MKLFPGILFFITSFLAIAAPQAELWDIWIPHNEESTSVIDHSPLDAFLSQYLVYDSGTEMNLVDYKTAKASGYELIDGYIKGLEQIKVRPLNRKEQKAYWINLYNAVTLRLILDHYPLKSIRDISFGFLGPGPWDQPLVTVEGIPLTLNDIEHRILRPIWEDPRIHFAVNCASIGCPDLHSLAFRAETTEQIMEEATTKFLNHPRGVRWVGSTLHLSSIFDWYEVDFTPNVLSYIAKYREDGDKIRPYSRKPEFSYDWALNERK